MTPRKPADKDSGDVTLAVLGVKMDAMSEKLDGYIAGHEKAHASIWKVVVTGFTVMAGFILGVWVQLSIHLGQAVSVVK